MWKLVVQFVYQVVALLPAELCPPSGLSSMGSHRVGHDWRDLAAAAAGDRKRGSNRMRQWAGLRELGFPKVFWHYKFLYTMYPACLVNIFKFELGFSYRLKTKKSLKTVWMVHNCERHNRNVFASKAPDTFRLLSKWPWSVDHKYLTGSQVRLCFDFSYSLLERKACGFLNIKNMVFHSLDLEENSSQCPCSWINNAKAAYVLKMWLWATGFWPCWCGIQTFISVTVPKGFTWQSVLTACYCWDLDMTDEIDKSQAIQPRGKGNIKFSLSGTIQ